jgi:dTDP-4-amino-4,6-dideoxygalactose transaminase
MTIVPFFDLRTQVRELRSEIDPALNEIFSQASFIMGPEVKTFEDSFAAFCGAKHCVGVGSGTSALKLSLEALGIGPGDEVILPANTYIASALAISHVGATPVFVDIDDAYHMDVARARAAITTRTRALMAVHLYGQAMPMRPLLDLAKSHGLRVIEDACQAHGAITEGYHVGTLGDIGCFSFYPSKNLGAYGDGGAVVTNESDLADAVRVGRDLGQRRKYEHLNKGENSRLDTIQAAILLVKLRHLRAWNARRREIAAVYDHELAALGVNPPKRQGPDAHVFHLYAVELPTRDQAMAQLLERGVQTAIHYPVPIHRQPAYADANLPEGSFPKTERVCTRILSLPMFPEMTDAQVGLVVSALRAVIEPQSGHGPKVPSHVRA